MIELELVSRANVCQELVRGVMTLRALFCQVEKMEKAVDAVKRNFATVRTGRANSGMLDRIMVWQLQGDVLIDLSTEAGSVCSGCSPWMSLASACSVLRATVPARCRVSAESMHLSRAPFRWIITGQ